MTHRADGFTLIETLVVAIVLGVLAAIAIPQLLRHREQAWRAVVQSDLRGAVIQFEIEARDNGGSYPLVMPPDVVRSPDVTLTIGGGATTARICLRGDHAGLGDSIYYDSSGGGLTTVAC